MLREAKLSGNDLDLTVFSPGGVPEPVRMEFSGVDCKSLGYEWWRAPLVARCRLQWGPGSLERLDPTTFKWVPRPGRV